MGEKIWIEVCLLSGRGLVRRSSSLWKLQWYAVGWIDPNDKYCTKIDASGKPNPVWKTGFSTQIEYEYDPSQPQPSHEELAIHVEVYSRDPIFLRDSLLGSTTILLKEFLDKYYHSSNSQPRNAVDEVGSFQLRKRNSSKPLGFVDVSIRISEEKEHPTTSSYLGGGEGFNLDNFGGEIRQQGSDHGSSQQPQTSYQMPNPPPVGGAAAPPPPLFNVGYIPNPFPMTSRYTPSSYMSMPSGGRGVGAGAGFGRGVGAGALAAGAVIFGDEFMSGFDVPAAARDASATISTYPPF